MGDFVGILLSIVQFEDEEIDFEIKWLSCMMLFVRILIVIVFLQFEGIWR